ncbi:MAG: type II toxin-antitoxin system HipA family toxin, partial [Microcella sp.]|nr:type II toxin-antitoxin system HipA family toxin [Microcella sp.]
LPGETEPVVAGRVDELAGFVTFTYALSYRQRSNAISLYKPELPLRPGTQDPVAGLSIPGCLRDGSPDSWGRNVIQFRRGVSENDISEIGYLLLSGTNRFGANDFQASRTEYVPRSDTAPFDELVDAATRLNAGLEVSRPVAEAFQHGTAIGGARPKVLIHDDDGTEWIAKLSSTTDQVFSVVRAEATYMELARRVGLRVPTTKLVQSQGRDVLLVERFDRTAEGGRQHVVSALTIAQLDEMNGRYATYPQILRAIRSLGSSGAPDPGPELFDRIAFNIAVGNSDDHARNHAAFWDGVGLHLTPAYDLAPNARVGEVATQAMALDASGVERASQFSALIRHAREYGLEKSAARDRIDALVDGINDHWKDAADLGGLTSTDRSHLWRRQVLNPYAFYSEP